jgi:hypothetical protein
MERLPVGRLRRPSEGSKSLNSEETEQKAQNGDRRKTGTDPRRGEIETKTGTGPILRGKCECEGSRKTGTDPIAWQVEPNGLEKGTDPVLRKIEAKGDRSDFLGRQAGKMGKYSSVS